MNLHSGCCASATTPLDVAPALVGAGWEGMDDEAVVTEEEDGVVVGGCVEVNFWSAMMSVAEDEVVLWENELRLKLAMCVCVHNCETFVARREARFGKVTQTSGGTLKMLNEQVMRMMRGAKKK